MKRIVSTKLYGIASVVSMMLLFFSSCEKHQTVNLVEYTEHTAQVMPDGRKTGVMYYMSSQCGHNASQCPNGCVHSSGGDFHADCQGWGSNCTLTSSIYVVPVSAGLYTATTQDSTELTTYDYFNMPARSLYTGMDESGLPRWLNIPAQLVFRDSTTRLFTFTGVFFSQQQVYKNQ